MDDGLKEGLEELKVDDDALETVAGGRGGESGIRWIALTNAPVYFQIQGEYVAVGYVSKGTWLEGLTRQSGGILRMDIGSNFVFFHLDARYMNEIEKRTVAYLNECDFNPR